MPDELRVTAAGAIAEQEGQSLAITAAGAVVEQQGQSLAVTAAGAIIEMEESRLIVTAAGVIVEFEAPPAKVLQETCAWALEVNGTDFWDYVEYGSVTVTQSERGETGTLTARLQNYDGTLDFSSLWKEVYLIDATTGYYLFGGYLIGTLREIVKR
jgi:hypothetical protein